jgi:hypothetical protein
MRLRAMRFFTLGVRWCNSNAASSAWPAENGSPALFPPLPPFLRVPSGSVALIRQPALTRRFALGGVGRCVVVVRAVARLRRASRASFGG